MVIVLKDLIGPERWVFIDDVIMFPKTAEEHALMLENVLQRFEAANLQLYPGRCVFSQAMVQYLGCVLLEEGISASPDKIEAVKKYPTPKGVEDVRAFTCLASFYRRLVPNFAEIAKLLTTLRERTSGLHGVQLNRRP
jgi:hypothetical protein